MSDTTTRALEDLQKQVKESGGDTGGVTGAATSGLEKVGDFIWNGLVVNFFTALIPTMFTAIFAVLKVVAVVLYYIFAKVVPFMVVYFGIPLFILGVIMALLFVGGHMFFLVAFFIGIYFYIKGVFNIKLKPPQVSEEIKQMI